MSARLRTALSKLLGLIAAGVFASSAAAQEAAEPRPAPEYFVASVVASTTAQALAQACPTISLDPPRLQAMTTSILQQLESDGFDVTRPDAGMLPTAEAFETRQQAFLQKHGLDTDPTPENACAAALAEIAEGSEIGGLLVEVPE